MIADANELRAALRDLLVLFHAVNSDYIGARNPYAFKAVRRANRALTGDAYEGGFAVDEECRALRDAGATSD